MLKKKVLPSGGSINTSAVYDNFRYKLEETPKTLRLVEMFLGNEAILGEVRGWKRSLLYEINQFFKNKDERERGYRLFLAIKVLNMIRQSKMAKDYLTSMKEITLEEVIFWVWQYHSYDIKAIRAFKYIHL